MRLRSLVLSTLAAVLVCTPPALAARGHVFQTSFGAPGSGDGQFQNPSGVAVDETTGEVYVVDRGNGRVEWFKFDTTTGEYEYTGQFNGSGELANEHGKKAGFGGQPDEEETGALSQPEGVAVDNTCYRREAATGKALTGAECEELDPSNGDVYVLDRDRRGPVDKFTAEGEYIGQTYTRKRAEAESKAEAEELAKKEGLKGIITLQSFELAGVAVGRGGESWVFEQHAVEGEKEGEAFGKKEIVKARIPVAGMERFANKEAPEFREFVRVPLQNTTFEGKTINFGSPEPGFAVNAENDFLLLVTGFAADVVEFNEVGEVLGDQGPGVSESNGDDFQGRNGLAAEVPSRAVYGSSDSFYTYEIYGANAGTPGDVVERFTRQGPRERAPLEVLGDGELSCTEALQGNCEGGLAVDSASGQVFVGQGTSDAVRVYELESPGAPVIGGEFFSGLTDDSVSFGAEVKPHSVPGETPTRYWFEYGACPSPASCRESFEGRTAPGALAPSFDVEAVTPAHVAGLRPQTAYHFRVVAENAKGRAVGGEHVFTTYGVGEFVLPDGRQWEMVSPPDKLGALIEPIGEDWLIQAAAGGGRVAYVALSPTEADPAGYPLYESVLATRGAAGGWSSRDLAVPHSSPARISVGEGWDYRFFSEDLSRAVVQPVGPFTPCKVRKVKQPCVSEEASEQTAFIDSVYGGGGEPCAASCLAPLVTGKKHYANVPKETVFGEFSTTDSTCPPTTICGPTFLGATPDASHIVLESWAALPSIGEPEAEIPPDSLYEWSSGEPASEQLRLISVLPGNKKGEALPAPYRANARTRFGFDDKSMRHAISDDGERVVWEASPEGEGRHLYLRENATRPQSPLGEHGECLVASDACTIQLDAGLSGTPQFQIANGETTRIFFTDGSKGTDDLYVYELGHGGPVDLTPGGKAFGAVIGASEDGSWVYFAADGALAAGAVSGSCGREAAQASDVCNLYVVHRGAGGWDAPRLVAVLSAADREDWGTLGASLAQLTARVSPNGEWLAFMSQRRLTGFDNRDAHVSGAEDQEVYEYNAQRQTLACSSCNPTGARPRGVEAREIDTSHGGLAGGFEMVDEGEIAANVPTWVHYTLEDSLHQPRYLSDSGRLFFNASDALVPKDANGTEDVYQYEPEGVPAGEKACTSSSTSGSVVFKPARSVSVEGRTVQEGAGCVGLISSGESSQESAFLDASETGSEVFFLTSAKLSNEDLDTARDVYDARECTAASPCPAPAAATPPPPCATEASCRPAPSPQPEIFGPSGSAVFSGRGNLLAPLPAPAAKHKTLTRVQRAQKLTRALRACGKDRNKRKRLACKKRARRRYGARTAGTAKRARRVGR